MEIYHSGKVYTQSGMQEAFVVDQGRFVYVGSNEGALQYPGRVIDLQGRFVCAGWNDSHMHLLHFGQALTLADLSDCTGSMEELQEGLRRFAEQHPVKEGRWLIGLGFNQDYFRGEKRYPNRYDLDEVSADYPVMVLRACGHMCVVNSKALQVMGLTASTPQVPGGRFELDEAGEPTGIFWENAIEQVNEFLPSYTPEDVKQMLEEAARWVNRQGITSVQTDDLVTLKSVDYRMVIQAYRELAAEGRLTVRVNEQCQFTGHAQLQEFLEQGYTTGVGDTMFKIGPLKIIGDGSLGAGTAWLLDSYADAPGQRGMEVCSYENLVDLITLAHTNGMQAAVHAIGDGEAENVLRAYETVLEQYPRSDHRHGVVHCQIMTPNQYERFSKCGLHAYIQSIFLDYDIRIVEARVGKERADSSYGGHCFLEQGITISNGSDAPVEKPGPLRGIQCAVTRQNLAQTCKPYRPDQALSVKEALDSFTVGGAYASFEETIKGDICEGMLADFVVLGQDPFETDPGRLSEIPVMSTWLGGECVYSFR